jgi:hypothetical protein
MVCGMERSASVLRKRVARSALAAGCTLAMVALGTGTATAADRAFERVTPADNFAEIETTSGFSSPDGNLLVYASTESLPGSVPNGPFPTFDSYTARRGEDGWATEWATDTVDEPGTQGSRVFFSTDDGMRQVIMTENKIDAGDLGPHSMDPYLRVRAADGSRTFAWLAPGPRTPTSPAIRMAYAMTDGLQDALVSTDVAMDPADVNQVTDLYLVSSDAARLVSSGSPAGTPRSAVAGKGGIGVPGTLAHDGSYVYFLSTERLSPQDTDSLNDVYRWNSSGGNRYELISVNRRTDPPSAEGAAELLGASDDGDVVCFTTTTALVNGDDDSRADVYCYTRSTDTLDWASAGLDPTVRQPSTALDMSKDGSSVYFSSMVRLTNDDPDSGPTGLSLYVRRGGVTTYVSPLSILDQLESRRAATASAGQRAMNVTADGRTVVFTTRARALQDRDADADADVYRWTVDGGLQLVSQGDAAGESMQGAAPSYSDLFTDNAVRGRVMTDDGATVFFESKAALTAEDTDGGYVDVYEWTPEDGVRLVSPAGDARYDSLYMDNSVDGSTVFFVTAQSLRPEDTNTARDVYAARIGGGFPLPPVVTPCEGEACQGPVPPPLTTPTPGTDSFSGPGDAVEPAPIDPKQQLVALTARERRALARRGRTAIRVSVNLPGTVSVTASARIGRRKRQVGHARARVARAGTVRLTLRLSKSARAQLRRGGRLRLTISSAYSQTDLPISRTVTLRG